MPAYNAEKTLTATYNELPHEVITKIILVDDFSKDRTLEIANSLGITTYQHQRNKGYGGNQKTCYDRALDAGADIVIMIHPDHQYDGTKLMQLIRPIVQNKCDIMLGNRIRSFPEAIAGGMPKYKYISNRILTLLEYKLFGLNLGEYHTGLRAYSSKVLVKLPWSTFSDKFTFDQDLLVSAIENNYTIGEIQIPVRYTSDSSSIGFIDSVRYGFSVLARMILYLLAKYNIYRDGIFVSQKDNA